MTVELRADKTEDDCTNGVGMLVRTRQRALQLLSVNLGNSPAVSGATT